MPSVCLSFFRQYGRICRFLILKFGPLVSTYHEYYILYINIILLFTLPAFRPFVSVLDLTIRLLAFNIYIINVVFPGTRNFAPCQQRVLFHHRRRILSVRMELPYPPPFQSSTLRSVNSLVRCRVTLLTVRCRAPEQISPPN